MTEPTTVQITELVIGEGPAAAKGALCFANYVGTLDDGRVFDSTSKHGRPYEFVVGSKKLIQGFSLGVLGMRPGGKRKFWIPSPLAYGERQMGELISPHSNLTFEVELLEVRPRD